MIVFYLVLMLSLAIDSNRFMLLYIIVFSKHFVTVLPMKTTFTYLIIISLLQVRAKKCG